MVLNEISIEILYENHFDTTGATSGTGTAYPTEAPEFTHGY
jgi:hypothetical protein